MFKKILIANRGEIACRIAKTCKKMGITTVGIYSDADARAKHLEFMDDVVHVGLSESVHSYLNIDKIIAIAKTHKVDAVHPGYGFLSENAKFASSLIKEGITFIGPPVKAIQTMGDKIESKKVARAAGVNVIPGGEQAIINLSAARREAKRIGYPIMIKASAGGGGKGMRVAKNEKDLESGLKSAKNEAKQAFGDDKVFIEKFIINPRHIEIQILGDLNGNMIYLGERECSIQRRHQKIIEECPSPLVDESMRKKMGEQALMLAKAVNYSSAGTVEFVATSDKSFYFLEMNTRLQVEHPVTELVLDLDLVEQMIKIAAKQRLSIKQSCINLNGWAIEARIYAEDPLHGFMPSTGRINSFLSPVIEKNNEIKIRLDSGVHEGSEVSMYYDPMMAKLVTHGKNRENARKNLSNALDLFVLDGISTNISFLNNVLNNKVFISGNINTSFIDQEYKSAFLGNEVNNEVKLIVAIASVCLKAIEVKRQMYVGEKNNGKFYATLEEKGFLFKYSLIDSNDNNDHKLVLEYKKDKFDVKIKLIFNSSLIKLILNNKCYYIQYKKVIGGYKVKHGGYDGFVSINSPYEYNLKKGIPKKVTSDTDRTLLSPMPGRVVKILIKKGQKIKIGEDLIILDAMKMENIIKAEKDSEVSEIFIKENDAVFVDQELMSFI